MSASEQVALTLGYYNRNASAFAETTADVDFAQTQDRFVALLAPQALILDFGCGSGRDAKYFLRKGLQVEATDGSAELCKIASDFAGIPVRNELFQDLADVNRYDGIWACSSILHLPKAELGHVLERMAKALKPNGVIYTSFKYGDFEGVRNGRYFTYFTETGFSSFLAPIQRLAIEEFWTSADVRPGREDEKWLNLLLRKTQR